MGRSGERPERTELNDPSLISNASEVQASVGSYLTATATATTATAIELQKRRSS